MVAPTVRLDSLYRQRFEEKDLQAKQGVWRALWEEVFSKLVSPGDTVLDVGAGYCEFINQVKAKRRIAVDSNPELPRFAETGVEIHLGEAQQLGFLPDASVDVAFSSNFFEHLPDKPALNAVVRELHRVVRPGGKLIAMGPNVRFLPGQYWDFYDHHIPLTEASVAELLGVEGFDVKQALPRFMPYSVKGRLPTWSWLVKLYLRLGRPAFALFGKQFLIVAERRSG